LSREWQHQTTGEIRLSCSIITLPPHPKLLHIHSKAMPLILPQESLLVDKWLNTQFNEVEQFEHLLQPHLPQNLVAQQIDKPMNYETLLESEVIHQD
jgi:putative SOS response-associated peptidase YedK